MLEACSVLCRLRRATRANSWRRLHGCQGVLLGRVEHPGQRWQFQGVPWSMCPIPDMVATEPIQSVHHVENYYFWLCIVPVSLALLQYMLEGTFHSETVIHAGSMQRAREEIHICVIGSIAVMLWWSHLLIIMIISIPLYGCNCSGGELLFVWLNVCYAQGTFSFFSETKVVCPILCWFYLIVVVISLVCPEFTCFTI